MKQRIQRHKREIPFYNEEYAQELLRTGQRETLIEYVIPVVNSYFIGAKLKLPRTVPFSTLEDMYSTFLQYSIKAIDKYDPSHGAKLLTWIYNYLTYAYKDFCEEEFRYFTVFVQKFEHRQN